MTSKRFGTNVCYVPREELMQFLNSVQKKK